MIANHNIPAVLLLERAPAIAGYWHSAIAQTSFTPDSTISIRARLVALVERLIMALLDDPVDRTAAQQVGAALVRLRYTHPQALDCTLDVLGRHLLDGLPEDDMRTLSPRLTTLLAALGGGFVTEMRDTILAEQEQIRQAFFVTRQEAEAAEAARANAEAAMRFRTDILHAAAHDLRAPITSILGRTGLLHMRLDREEMVPAGWLRQQVDGIRTGVLRMHTMIEELLDAARLQANQHLEMRLEELELGTLVRDAVSARQPASTHCAVPITLAIADGIAVFGDRARLERVVDNILGNAVKYGAGAPVDVTVCRDGDYGVVTIRDRGIGIPEDELAQVFTPFYRASTAHGLPGIGLSGSKAIVEQHGGQMTIDSAPGAGTTVTIALPSIPSTHSSSEAEDLS